MSITSPYRRGLVLSPAQTHEFARTHEVHIFHSFQESFLYSGYSIHKLQTAINHFGMYPASPFGTWNGKPENLKIGDHAGETL